MHTGLWWYNRRRFGNLRPKNCLAILAGIAKAYSIGGYGTMKGITGHGQSIDLNKLLRGLV